MARFTYSGDSGRYYAELGVTVNDGDTVSLDDMPNDGHWSPAKPKSTTASDAATDNTAGGK